MTRASTPEEPEDAKPTERLSTEPQPVEQQPSDPHQGPPPPPDPEATQALDFTQAFPPGTPPPGATVPISHSMNTPGQDSTQAMPAIPPNVPGGGEQQETLSSSAHEPKYQQPPQTFGQPGPDDPTQAYGRQDYPPPNYPPQGYAGPQGYASPGQYGHYDQHGQHPRQHQPGQRQPSRPRRETSRGAWFGVLLTLFLTFFASVGTFLVLLVWGQMNWGAGFGTALQNTFEGLTSDVGGFLSTLPEEPGLLVASGLCLVSTILIPLTNAGARTFGILLLLGAAVTYTVTLIYRLGGNSFTPTFDRWSSFPQWWQSANLADVYLAPFFFLVALIAIGVTKPRKVR